MGIDYIKIRNFKSAKRIDYDFSKGNINCLLGKNGVGKTTIDRAMMYFYTLANNPYAVQDVIDRKNPYVQKASIEICYDFSKLLECREHNVYIDSNINEFEEYISDHKLKIKLTQYKNGKTEWSPINDRFKIGRILKIFPLYMIQTKNIDSKAWLELWDVVADVAITGLKENKTTIRECLKEGFQQIYGDKYVKVLDTVDSVINDQKLSLNENDFKKRFKNALVANFGGDYFLIDDESVDYYSDGINSLRYLSLLLKLLAELSGLSWKQVTVILDEPEISLHLQFVEELARVIVGTADRLKFLLATHSTRLISSLLIESTSDCRVVCSQVYAKNGYTCIKRIHDIIGDKEKYLMRDNEAESYFANAIVFVEGQTEIQLLKNKNIVGLFPKLKQITVYNTNSNDSATKLILPGYNKPTVPFLVILDMDKILDYSKENRKYYLRNANPAVNPLANKVVKENEKYLYYGPRKKTTYYLRRKIEKQTNKEVIISEATVFVRVYDFFRLIELVKEYCKNYRTIVFKTTVEGAIICEESLEIICKWLMNYWEGAKYNDFISQIKQYNAEIQVSIVRGIFHGKLDCLLTFDDDFVPDEIKKIISRYKSGSKVDGWVFSFFNWFFSNEMSGNIEEDRAKFKTTFPEIYEVVCSACGML